MKRTALARRSASALLSSFSSFAPPALAALVVLTIASPASAFRGITGYSGKPYNGISSNCATTCHTQNKSTPPRLTVTFRDEASGNETSGETPTITAKGKVDVTIVVAGSLNRTSMNAALTTGVVGSKGQNTEIPFEQEPEEIAAVDPPPSGATGTYKFSFIAPSTNGTINLWVAGMSASGGGTGGDGVTALKRDITVTGGTTPQPDAGAPDAGGGVDAGSTTDGGGGSSGSSGSSGATEEDAGGAGDDDDDGSSGGSSSGRPRLTQNDEGGCSAGPSSDRGALAFAPVAMAAAALAIARRRRSAK